MYLATLTRQPAWLVFWFSVAWGFNGFCDVVFWTTSIELGGRRGGTTGSICNFGGNVGGILGPVVSPFLAERLGLGWGVALTVGSLLCLLGVVAWLRVDPTDRLA